MARLFITLLLLCASQAAFAGQRAIYRDPEGKPLTIDIADNGDAVVHPDKSEEYAIWKGGQLYLIGHEGGQLQVARIEDLAAAFDQVLPPVFKSLFGAAAKDKPSQRIRIEPKGKRTVAGFEGQVYAVYGMGDQKPSESTEFVMSKDPKLRPTGQVMEAFVVGIIVPLAPMIGEMAAHMAEDMRTIFAYGAPLDAGGRFQLLSVETVDVPPSSVALPAPPQTVDQIVAAMKARAAQAQSPPPAPSN